MKLIFFLISLVVCTFLGANATLTVWGNVNVDVWGKREIIVDASPFKIQNFTFKFPLTETVRYFKTQICEPYN